MAELPLTMPKMSMTMEEGTMVTWLKNVGDSIRAGEAVCEVATDKVDMEVESPVDGVLASISANPDDVIKVGDPIAMITTDADDLLGGLFDEPAAPEAATAAVSASDIETETAEPVAEAPAPGSDWPAAVPAARTQAAQHGVDLQTVSGSGPWGSILVQDVDAAASGVSTTTAAPPAPTAEPAAPSETPAPQAVPVAAPAAEAAPTAAAPAAAPSAAPVDASEARRRRTRALVAKAMTASAAVPQFTAFIDLDLGPAQAVRKTELLGASWTVLFVRAHAMALRANPALMGMWNGSEAVPGESIGVALAVDTPNGLLAPVIRDPDTCSLPDLISTIAAAVDKTRAGTLGADDLSGGTTVFSNLGGFGVRSFNALITPPHASALSAGAAEQRVVVLPSGAFTIKQQCTVGLTTDHRVADGADAARYLAALREIIEDPARLLGAS